MKKTFLLFASFFIFSSINALEQVGLNSTAYDFSDSENDELNEISTALTKVSIKSSAFSIFNQSEAKKLDRRISAASVIPFEPRTRNNTAPSLQPKKTTEARIVAVKVITQKQPTCTPSTPPATSSIPSIKPHFFNFGSSSSSAKDYIPPTPPVGISGSKDQKSFNFTACSSSRKSQVRTKRRHSNIPE